MTTLRNIAWFALAALVATGAFSDDENYKKCDAETDACVRKMVDKLGNRGWIGIEWDNEAEIPVLTLIAGDSPAERAGLERGDVLLAFNGVKTSEGDEAVWAEAKRSLIPGNTITLTIERSGAKKEVDVVLVPLPRQIMAQWIGNHVLEHHLAEKEEEPKGDAERSSP